MTLIVETGAGLPDAESYLSEPDSLLYHESRGNGIWTTITAEQREQALRRATDYMLSAFREKWKGQRATATQSLDWPRLDVVADGYPRAADEVPLAVRNACAELALRAAQGELDPDPEPAIKRKKVAVLELEFYEPAQVLRRHKGIADMLSPYLAGSGMNVRLVRA